MGRLRSTMLVLAFAAVAAACGGSGGGAPNPVGPSALAPARFPLTPIAAPLVDLSGAYSGTYEDTLEPDRGPRSATTESATFTQTGTHLAGVVISRRGTAAMPEAVTLHVAATLSSFTVGTAFTGQLRLEVPAAGVADGVSADATCAGTSAVRGTVTSPRALTFAADLVPLDAGTARCGVSVRGLKVTLSR
jgi:hypothetical protein